LPGYDTWIYVKQELGRKKIAMQSRYCADRPSNENDELIKKEIFIMTVQLFFVAKKTYHMYITF